MTERDEELDQLLKPFHETQPLPTQMGRWRSLGQSNNASQTTVLSLSRSNSSRRWMELAAAVMIGFVIGISLMRPHPTQYEENKKITANFDADATIERVYSKSE